MGTPGLAFAVQHPGETFLAGGGSLFRVVGATMSGMDFKYPDPKPRRSRAAEYLPLLVLIAALLFLFVKTRMDQLRKKSEDSLAVVEIKGDAPPPSDSPSTGGNRTPDGTPSVGGPSSNRQLLVKHVALFDKPLNQTQPTPKHLGLLAKIYSIQTNYMHTEQPGPDHLGDLISQRVDSGINLALAADQLPKDTPATDYEIIWLGLMKAPETGTYFLQMEADDGVRLFIDGEQLLDEWRIQPPTLFRVRVQMEQGWHQLKVEYFQGPGGAVARFYWDYPFHTGNHLVPPPFFAHP
jgi:hypothetical protein